MGDIAKRLQAVPRWDRDTPCNRCLLLAQRGACNVWPFNWRCPESPNNEPSPCGGAYRKGSP